MTEFLVKVQIGVTPEVVSLVSAILNKQPAVEAPQPSEKIGQLNPEETQQPAGKRGRKPKTEKPEAEEPAPGTVMQHHDPEPEPAADPAPAVEDMPDDVYYPSEEDVRTAMHVARERIEGKDYKDNPNNGLHKPMTEVFKAMAKTLSGQTKPSALAQELRQTFIDASRTIQRGEDGQLTYTLNAQ